MTPPTTILNDVLAFAVRSAFLDLHSLPTYDADQQVNQGAFVVVQTMSARFVGLQETFGACSCSAKASRVAQLSPSLMASLVATLLPQFLISSPSVPAFTKPNVLSKTRKSKMGCINPVNEQSHSRPSIGQSC
jgi:hypothetical protein